MTDARDVPQALAERSAQALLALARAGDELTAHAQELWLGGRSGIWSRS